MASPDSGRYIAETQAFFASRAATWDTRFGDDTPAYVAAVARAGIPRGGVVVDVGCGTGRALPALRQAVGPDGTVIAADLTPEMLAAARPKATAAHATLVIADASAKGSRRASADSLFAAGLVNHLPDPQAGLGELARVARPGGLLVLFHPSGRAALAARHGRMLTQDELLSAGPLTRSTLTTGWRLAVYDDAPDHFFALAVRQLPALGLRSAPKSAAPAALRVAGLAIVSRKSRAAAAAARRQASRTASKPSAWARWSSMALAMGSRTTRWPRSKSVGSSPTRSSRASLSSRCERISRTCSTGACSQRCAASLPTVVAA